MMSIKINQKTMGQMAIDDKCRDKLKSLLPVGRKNNSVLAGVEFTNLETPGGIYLRNNGIHTRYNTWFKKGHLDKKIEIKITPIVDASIVKVHQDALRKLVKKI
ncbi:MAG: hypothetical protein P857_860 [Candidatus Xenolissoclinum pacificiensis L6]|uniref:Uncharacterized protein n=1 Tax=Candidatus Xenolissoclinum pacificiensis L6 TaxID=1401685 RepID=W2V0D0_9RICK|nr:MAG: hypothetical protein P857_860 [Candidatus Xenolissoclinum pacificiensis L6]